MTLPPVLLIIIGLPMLGAMLISIGALLTAFGVAAVVAGMGA